MTLRAFHNDPRIKAKYLARVRRHRVADRLVSGIGWEDGKGCAIGCTLEAYDHERYPIELGIPQPLAHLEDTIFENLEPTAAQLWPEKFLRAIPVGADLSEVIPQFLSWLMLDSTYGVAFTTEDATSADLAAEIGFRYAAADFDGRNDLTRALAEAQFQADTRHTWSTRAMVHAWGAGYDFNRTAQVFRLARQAWQTGRLQRRASAFVEASAAVLLELLANAEGLK